MAAQISENIPKFVDNQYQAQLPIISEMDKLIQKSFHIPANVVLPEDISKVKGCNDYEIDELKKTLDDLRNQFQQVWRISIFDSLN